jgi:hypothetical protein
MWTGHAGERMRAGDAGGRSGLAATVSWRYGGLAGAPVRKVSMAKQRLFFDEKRMPSDVADVLEATALLEVTEFHLFRLAYQRWHGTAIDDAALERYYLPYMFRSRVPLWVRALSREVIAAADAEALDPKAYGVEPRPLSMDMYNRGLRYFLWITVILGTLLTGAATVAELVPWYESCYFPPCY